jgi:hypothetical protein
VSCRRTRGVNSPRSQSVEHVFSVHVVPSNAPYFPQLHCSRVRQTWLFGFRWDLVHASASLSPPPVNGHVGHIDWLNSSRHIGPHFWGLTKQRTFCRHCGVNFRQRYSGIAPLFPIVNPFFFSFLMSAPLPSCFQPCLDLEYGVRKRPVENICHTHTCSKKIWLFEK